MEGRRKDGGKEKGLDEKVGAHHAVVRSTFQTHRPARAI